MYNTIIFQLSLSLDGRTAKRDGECKIWR